MTKRHQSDYIDWDAGREGYVDVPRAATYVPVRFNITTEERIGSLVAAAVTIWATYAATSDYAALWRLQILPPGPLEVCALGILVWLHAKWRRSTKVD